ncbi:helix-turn-helix domain-containing protein [Pontimonas sp.]|nr:helix-turn-helix domain-containing protein [Pontimonas sp.]MDA8886999.1 helix-turn-helix domain-containing protein [Pontimonas sp.]
MSAAMTKKQTLSWLRNISGEMASATLARLERDLPWYKDMPPSRRSAVGMVAQAGITSFISWYESPGSTPWIASDVFGVAPRELLRSVSLQQTLQLIKVTVEVVEDFLKDAPHELREGILHYSRDIAFAAADVYARAAEARGLWDARLEALVVDSILSGEYDQELPSRIAALGWTGHGEVSVIVGTSPRMVDVDAIRRTARHHDTDVLVGVQGNRLVVVVGRRIEEDSTHEVISFIDIAAALDESFGPGTYVVGPTVPAVVDAVKSAKAALAGFSVAKSRREPPRPLLADDVLPERALAGDPLARRALIQGIYEPLRDHALDLLGTVWTYFETGHSLEATARELFVHPNTVRYRLKKVIEVVDWDPGAPRDAFTIHVAVILGSMSEPNQGPSSAGSPKL